MTPLGRVGGLDGWFVEVGAGETYSLYLTGDGHAVTGLLYGPDGTLLTGGQLESAGRGKMPARAAGGSADKVGSPAAETVVAAGRDGVGAVSGVGAPLKLKRAPAGAFGKGAAAFGFTLGRSGPVVLVFADPGCSWSRSTVAELGQRALGGRFRLTVVPVGVLGGESAESAIRIVSSADPARAWFGDDVADLHRAGGLWIEGNNEAFEGWGEDAVPLIAWRSAGSGDVYVVGALSDPDRWVEEVFGP